MIGIVIALGVTGPASATDHADARRLILDRKADISDQYAWVPREGVIAVGVMTRPYSARRSRFAEDVVRRVVVRKATLHGTGDDIAVTTGAQAAVTCTVEAADRRPDDRMRCETVSKDRGRLVASATIGDDRGSRTPGMVIFAGVRIDPFFVDTSVTLRLRPRDGNRFPLGGRDAITPWGIQGRVQALLVEVDVAELFDDPGGLFAVHSETWVAGEQVDRSGRPEITGFVLPKDSRGGELPGEDVRSAWNRESTYDLDDHHRPLYRAAMAAGLARLDGLDRFAAPPRRARRARGPEASPDWPVPHPFVDLLLQDAVLVDPSRPCRNEDSTFFEIEMASYRALSPDERGLRNQTCGGRTPNADVVDALLTLFINGPERVVPGPPHHGPPGAYVPVRGDGVHRPAHPATDAFPYFRHPRLY